MRLRQIALVAHDLAAARAEISTPMASSFFQARACG
jgi:hypothetical protein